VLTALVAAPACASGGASGDDTPEGSLGGERDASVDGSLDHDAAPEAAFEAGQPGATCSADADCSKGKCRPIGRGPTPKACVVPCVTGQACPAGTYCEWLGTDGYQCVPDRASGCSPCQKDDACIDPADRCLVAPAGDRFCAQDCSFDGTCPGGYECVDWATYTGADAGALDSGGTISDAGGELDAATDGPTSWPDGGGQKDAGEAGVDAGSSKHGEKYCVPAHGLSCACGASRDKVVRACSKKGPAGACIGKETCDGATGAWSACDAADPIAETCNGKDDDCDGAIDDGPGDQLCAGMGLPPHGSWICEQAKCTLGGCDHGWTNFPPGGGPGCSCPVDPGEPNDQCSQAQPVGNVSDAQPGALTVTGTLSWNTDADWYTFRAADVNQGSANKYHVHVGFTSNPNDEFVFDVIRGATCLSPSHSNNGTGLTEYDWCVDFGGSNLAPGELSCSAAVNGLNRCRDHSSTYFVRVWRKAGAVPSCSPYTLTITGSGPGNVACDTSSACDPHVDGQ
jgi:hypothetical protein